MHLNHLRVPKARALRQHTVGKSNQKCKETSESNVWVMQKSLRLDFCITKKKWNYRFQSYIWFWRLLLYKISVKFKPKSIHKYYIQRNYLVKILRFLYIFSKSGLLCGVTLIHCSAMLENLFWSSFFVCEENFERC